MLKILAVLVAFFGFMFTPQPVLAQGVSQGVVDYTNTTLQYITVIAAAAAVFFLIKAGYTYITSTGKPEALDSAKRTFKNALIGLVLVLSANVVTSVFKTSLIDQNGSASGTPVEMVQIETSEPSDGLTQILIDAVSGFIQNIVESATEPIVDGVIGFLTTTPRVIDNQVIREYWTVSVGIVDTLFVLVVALAGLQIMSATTFGFEEADIKQILPRIGLAFLGANVSLFLSDYVILTGNTLVNAVLDSTGGLNRAFIVDAINPTSYITGSTPLIILIFLVLFLIVSVVLLLMYVSRLILISLGAVLSPFIFLIWSLPKFSDYATVATKTYFVTIFISFVHVVIIQLAGAFLALPDHNENSLMAIAIAIGLFITLVKTPAMMMTMIYYTARNGIFGRMGQQIINVLTTDTSASATREATKRSVKQPRKVVGA